MAAVRVAAEPSSLGLPVTSHFVPSCSNPEPLAITSPPSIRRQQLATMASHAGSEYDDGEHIPLHKSQVAVIRDILFAAIFTLTKDSRTSLLLDNVWVALEAVQLVGFYIRPLGVPVYEDAGFRLDVGVMDWGLDDFTSYFSATTAAIWFVMMSIAWVCMGAYGSIMDPGPADTTGNISCLSSQALPLTVVGLATMSLFVPLSLGISLLCIDINPILKDPLSKVHGRVGMLECALKTTLVIVWAVLPGQYLITLAVAFAVPLISLLAIWLYFPHYSLRLNQMRAAMYGGASAAGAISLLSAVAYNFSQQTGSVAIVISMGVAFVVFGVLVFYLTGGSSQMRDGVGSRSEKGSSTPRARLLRHFPKFVPLQRIIYRYIQHSTTGKLQALVNGTLPDSEVVFTYWPHVEITARITTAHMDFRRTKVVQEKVEMMHRIFKHGVSEFPDTALVRLCYAAYMLQLQASKTEPSRQLKRVEQLHPALDIKFQIMHQDREVEFLGPGVRLDVAGFAEYQKLERKAKVSHYKALKYLQEVYSMLFHEPHRIAELESISRGLKESVAIADETYSQLTTIFYAQFCLDVLKDGFKSNLLTTRADRLENKYDCKISLESFGMKASMSRSQSRAEKVDGASEAQSSDQPRMSTVRSVLEQGDMRDMDALRRITMAEPQADDGDILERGMNNGREPDHDSNDAEFVRDNPSMGASPRRNFKRTPSVPHFGKAPPIPATPPEEKRINRYRPDGEKEAAAAMAKQIAMRSEDDKLRNVMRVIDAASSVGTSNMEQKQAQVRDVFLVTLCS
ncbi:hypothetical protein BDK51DRAFT_43565 [Blyttiomyces helicus]|uniref:TmcB/TmcC TPR repeats domain-containing protein n=1 Tax=Blyttiomyces helicus TaxID=388810 RepID=A0A4P9WCV4_9FUNG|nr:hypothetical protein BDK51DRAFT_43565 [Blyttiomyces helicus]|eukprot:RKO89505.1 hypothetical protein BDK51DRAFT_43565 [Blyttiomyces helicus]